MSNQGWISLHRSIQDHWIYEKRTFSKFEAWVDMLMLANHQDNKFLLGNELVFVERGQFVTSELKLMDRWKWSKTKVRNFLKMLEEDKMIQKKSDKKKTTLTICNYSFYQDKRTTEEPQENHEKTTKEPQEDTNNNDNNVNNENNTWSEESDEYRLSLYLYNHMLKNNPDAKKPNLQTWAKHIDYMLRLDNRSTDGIKKIIEFSQNDNFWKSNILSTSKLREKYDQLVLKMKPVQEKPKSQNLIGALPCDSPGKKRPNRLG